MNKQEYNMKDNDFIAGYVYSTLLRDLNKVIKTKNKSLCCRVYIPESWIDYRYTYYEGIIECVKNEFAKFTSSLEETQDWEICFAKYYRGRITFCLKKNEPRKKMTIEEIEKLLGYKIEVIENHDK